MSESGSVTDVAWYLPIVEELDENVDKRQKFIVQDSL